MTSVTADTNIYISGFEFGGLPEQFLQLARDGAFRLDISESIKREVLRVLRDKFEYPAQALLAAEVQIDRITTVSTRHKRLMSSKPTPPISDIGMRGRRKE